MNSSAFPKTRAFLWKKNRLLLLDQRLLPDRTVWISCQTWPQVAKAITDMVVRGAPALGCVAAYGMVLAAKPKKGLTLAAQKTAIDRAFDGLLQARPTAVNLRWAL